ncbi:MAG: histidinol-phosphatase [Lewinellaceae bacterium]|nr:histidinol-phosphatase [Lewinellaceae bacterium]
MLFDVKIKVVAGLATILFLAAQPPVSAQNRLNWYKGNLHTHSYWSDGDEFPERIMGWYKSRGYHFLALSDHNTLAEGEKWITVKQKPEHLRDFDQYLEEFGTDWVVYKKEENNIQVRLKTYAEYKPLFEEPARFLILQAEEITDRYDKKPVHLNATNIQKHIEPQGGGSVAQVLQNNIDAVLKYREESGTPAMVHVNHPNFGYAISLADMIELRGERFFEIYNGHNAVHNLGDSTHMSTEEMWDLINIAYLDQQKPLIYGLATDDSHHYHETGRKFANAGRGWVMVQADSLSAGALIDAMERGQFYASTGVELRKLRFSKNKLTIRVKKERGVHYTIQFVGCRQGDRQTQVLTEKRSSRARFKLDANLRFVRAVVTSDKLQENPVETFLFEKAWTQPVERGGIARAEAQ